MAHLDISESAFSGFKVIGRSWFAPVVWGLVQVLLSILPFLLVAPALVDLFQSIFGGLSHGAQPDEAEIMRLTTQLNVVQPLSWITQLLAQGLVTGAVFRAVLHPEDKGWFYMRLGMGELMLVAVSLVFSIIMIMAMVVLAIIVAIAGFAVGAANRDAGIIVAVVLGIVALGVIIWGSLRFSLGFAASHDKKQFLLFESWKQTAGHAGGLFGMGLLSVIVGWLISVVIVVLLAGVGIFLVLGNGGFEALQSLDDTQDFSAFFTPQRLQALIGFGVFYLLVVTAIQGYVGTIFTAPWAEAYRQLGTVNDEVF